MCTLKQHVKVMDATDRISEELRVIKTELVSLLKDVVCCDRNEQCVYCGADIEYPNDHLEGCHILKIREALGK